MSARALARVDLSAIEANTRLLSGQLQGSARLCAVVKADAYGHGMLPCARAALSAGATWLAVATAEEALALREGGIEETPILVMGALDQHDLPVALLARADVVVWREEQIGALAGLGGGRVHVKLDTGMGRLGTRDPEEATRVARLAAATPGVELAGLMTHFATAEEHDRRFFTEQLERFRAWALPLREEHPQVILHAANSAAAMLAPASHLDMVRCGIALYGLDPANEDGPAHGLRPALSLCSYLAEVKPLQPGESAGYGRTFIAGRATHIGVVPIGYGDGLRRGLSNTGRVLIAGASHPIAGTVSMDNITVDLGPDPAVLELRGQAVTLIGAQGPQRITAEEMARSLGTINYEITCGLTPRSTRLHLQAERLPPESLPQEPIPGEGS